jgi:hypothetical protein
MLQQTKPSALGTPLMSLSARVHMLTTVVFRPSESAANASSLPWAWPTAHPAASCQQPPVPPAACLRTGYQPESSRRNPGIAVHQQPDSRDQSLATLESGAAPTRSPQLGQRRRCATSERRSTGHCYQHRPDRVLPGSCSSGVHAPRSSCRTTYKCRYCPTMPDPPRAPAYAPGSPG